MIEKITALYARFSRDDGQETENASITNQRQLLQEYADHNGYTNCRFYADDGYTGTNFDRPDFQRMLEDIENGLISTVIVKDMSRFGRNYILVGQYVELVLPQYNVRVIGITDNYDSSRNDNDLFAFENILNEMYTADISRKVTMVKHNKANNGGKMKTRPLYGYKTVEGTIDDWEIDDPAAAIVYMMFDMYVNQDMGEYKIANYLRKNKVATPCVYYGSKQGNPDAPYNWQPKTVQRMLGYQEYCGDTVNFKTKTIAYKTKTRIRLPQSEWKITPNTHPAIISRELFDKAQYKLNRKDKRHCDKKHEYDTYFRQKCICSECNKTMIAYIPLASEEVAYQCKYNMRFKTCKSHNIREEIIRRYFKEQLTKLHDELIDNQNGIYEKLGIIDLSEMKSKLESNVQRIQELDTFIKALFESKFDREISDDDFKMMNAKYSAEREELQKSINELSEKINVGNKETALAIDKLSYIKALSKDDLNNLNAEICDNLVEKIIVGETYWTGEVNYGKQQVDIYLYGIGKIGDIVDVAYKTFEERILMVLPELLATNNYAVSVVCEKLNLPYNVLKKGLQNEGLTFTIVKTKARAMLK